MRYHSTAQQPVCYRSSMDRKGPLLQSSIPISVLSSSCRPPVERAIGAQIDMYKKFKPPFFLARAMSPARRVVLFVHGSHVSVLRSNVAHIHSRPCYSRVCILSANQ